MSLYSRAFVVMHPAVHVPVVSVTHMQIAISRANDIAGSQVRASSFFCNTASKPMFSDMMYTQIVIPRASHAAGSQGGSGEGGCRSEAEGRGSLDGGRQEFWRAGRRTEPCPEPAASPTIGDSGQQLGTAAPSPGIAAGQTQGMHPTQSCQAAHHAYADLLARPRVPCSSKPGSDLVCHPGLLGRPSLFPKPACRGAPPQSDVPGSQLELERARQPLRPASPPVRPSAPFHSKIGRRL